MTRIVDLRGDRRIMGGTTKRAVNNINRIARHHSATASGDVFIFQNHWRNLGWATGGYHEVILRDGTVQIAYGDAVLTNGIRNHNPRTYHICLVGNGNFTEAQERAFEERARAAMKRFRLNVSDVWGHNEFPGAVTACPGIDMTTVRNRLNTAPTVTPSGNTHTVRAGETLWSISRQHNTTVAELRTLNNLPNDIIRVGQVLRLPSGNVNRYFPVPANRNLGLVDSLNSVRVDSSFANRQRIARVNGMPGNTYTGTATQNNTLLNLLRQGRLIRP